MGVGSGAWNISFFVNFMLNFGDVVLNYLEKYFDLDFYRNF